MGSAEARSSFSNWALRSFLADYLSACLSKITFSMSSFLTYS